MDLVKSFYASPLLSSWHLKPKQRPEENTSSPTLYFSNFMIMSVKKRVLFLLLVLPFFSSFYALALYEMKPVLESTKLLPDLFPPISPKFQSDILSNSSHYSIIISSSKLYTFTKEFSVRWKKMDTLNDMLLIFMGVNSSRLWWCKMKLWLETFSTYEITAL